MFCESREESDKVDIGHILLSSSSLCACGATEEADHSSDVLASIRSKNECKWCLLCGRVQKQTNPAAFSLNMLEADCKNLQRVRITCLLIGKIRWYITICSVHTLA
ncbi:Hypothetical predicted protein [Podarcis lilfordi]|uniref:Uncharacterized protein n=1 Tax=Podarcis lilfordi TaxID=74358 RepID=A0AA35L5C5_9SAUR|nr:Hypothetical predicted protein [Podarcis lilfordi]